jgi:hypothetical protein
MEADKPSLISMKSLHRPNLMTVRVTCQRYLHAFPTERVLRNLLFKVSDRMPTKGMIKVNRRNMAVWRIGRKVLIDEHKLLEWFESKSV